jgi:hypothetical protein
MTNDSTPRPAESIQPPLWLIGRALATPDDGPDTGSLRALNPAAPSLARGLVWSQLVEQMEEDHAARQRNETPQGDQNEAIKGAA